PTPEPRLRVPGVEIHAAAIQTLLTGRPIVGLSETATWSLLFVVSAAAAWMVLRFDLGPASLAILATLAMVYGAAQLVFSAGHLWVRYVTLALGGVEGARTDHGALRALRLARGGQRNLDEAGRSRARRRRAHRHGPVLRHPQLHRDDGGTPVGRGAPVAQRLPDGDGRGDSRARGLPQQVHRRRDHGPLRRAPQRGCREGCGARRPRGTRDAGAARGHESHAGAASRLRSAAHRHRTAHREADVGQR